jgi:hypoxia up-regulated 1
MCLGRFFIYDISKFLHSDRIALNVNADEASVLGMCKILTACSRLIFSLGAGLYGAGLSRQFKTKNIKVQDITPHDIQASYFAAPTSGSTKPRTITSTIFPSGAKVGTKKTLTFKRKEDFSVHFDYKTDVAP